MTARLPSPILDSAVALDQVSAQWDADILRQLTEYIGIPAKSPTFDSEWKEHGYIDTVMRNAAAWVEAQKVEGLKLEVVRLEGRTPVLFFEIPASAGTQRQMKDEPASSSQAGAEEPASPGLRLSGRWGAESYTK